MKHFCLASTKLWFPRYSYVLYIGSCYLWCKNDAVRTNDMIVNTRIPKYLHIFLQHLKLNFFNNRYFTIIRYFNQTITFINNHNIGKLIFGYINWIDRYIQNSVINNENDSLCIGIIRLLQSEHKFNIIKKHTDNE